MRQSPKGAAAKRKMKLTMDEFESGTLHSGSKSGPLVTDKSQALAIGINQAKRAARKRRKRAY